MHSKILSIHFLIRASLSKVPIGYCSNSSLYFPRKSCLKLNHTRKFSTPLYYSFFIKNNKSSFKRIKSNFFWHRTNQFPYQKDSQNGFRLDNSCGILSIIPFHFSFPLVTLVNSDLQSNYYEIQSKSPIKYTESPNLIKKSISYIVRFVSEYIIEPILITCRFIYLLCLFLPLIIGSPIILIGERVSENDNERTGTLWWYNMLVRRMEQAGPTFIKVCDDSCDSLRLIILEYFWVVSCFIL